MATYHWSNRSRREAEAKEADGQLEGDGELGVLTGEIVTDWLAILKFSRGRFCACKRAFFFFDIF